MIAFLGVGADLRKQYFHCISNSKSVHSKSLYIDLQGVYGDENVYVSSTPNRVAKNIIYYVLM